MVNDPLGLNKGDPNTTCCYEIIEIVMLDKVDKFMKIPKKSYDTENTNFNQLEFPINHLMFSLSQFKLAESLKDKDNFKKSKICFDVILKKEKKKFRLL